jgi:hypothetical protein
MCSRKRAIDTRVWAEYPRRRVRGRRSSPHLSTGFCSLCVQHWQHPPASGSTDLYRNAKNRRQSGKQCTTAAPRLTRCELGVLLPERRMVAPVRRPRPIIGNGLRAAVSRPEGTAPTSRVGEFLGRHEPSLLPPPTSQTPPEARHEDENRPLITRHLRSAQNPCRIQRN